MEKEQEEEEEFNDAVVSMGEERVHNATYSKLDHVYYAGGRAYRAKEAMEFRYNFDIFLTSRPINYYSGLPNFLNNY